MKLIQYEDLKIDQIAKDTADIIKNGGVCIIPFDTVYGLVCDPRNEEALKKLFEFKNRKPGHTIGVAVDSIESLEKISEISERNRELIAEKTPGKFTFIVPEKDQTISENCRLAGTIGIRIPDNELILKIAAYSGGVIAQTSANKSGMPNCRSVNDLKEQYSEGELKTLDLIIDGGDIESLGASTIINLVNEGIGIIERTA